MVQYKLGVQCRTPSRSDRFNGVTGVQGGPKGRNRNLPWPPCKKVIRKLLSLLFISTPPSRLTPCQLPAEGRAFWCALQPLVQSRRAANDGPYSAAYKLSAIIKGRPPVPLLLYSLSQSTSPAPYSARHSGSVRLGRIRAARSARRRLSLPRCPCRSACPAGRSAGSRGAPPFQARCGGPCSR